VHALPYLQQYHHPWLFSPRLTDKEPAHRPVPGLCLRHMLEQLITGTHDALFKSLEGDDFRRYIDKGTA